MGLPMEILARFNTLTITLQLHPLTAATIVTLRNEETNK
jgi:hypothetical protein